MSNVLNLTIDALHEAYATGSETPESLFSKLRSQALAQDEFNAWVYLLSEKELAAYLDALHQKPIESTPLWGIPFAIKDNIDLEHIPTSAGCEAFTYFPEKSATVVALLIEAGAIPLGKTNLDQFATGLVGTRSPFGEGKNVFNTDYISGGSSAGSAIATALGQVSFALGTDTAGSGRVPAAFNNLIGHKPTKGLLSTTGVIPACKSLDCVSIFALTAADVVQVLDVAALEVDDDPYSRKNQAFNSQPYWRDEKPAPFSFGIPDQLDFDGDARAEELFHLACEQLKQLGGQPVEISFEPFLKTARLLYEGPWVAERAWATKDVDPNSMLPVIQEILATTQNFDVTDTFDAQYKLQALKRICDSELDKVDFVVTPTTPTCYLRSQIEEKPIAWNSKLGTYTNFMNLLDYTATAIPTGRLSSGVSWGVTLFGLAFTDIELLSFVGALQRQLNLPLGATPHLISQPPKAGRVAPAQSVDVVVCGAHLLGQPLNWQLQDRGAEFKMKTTTERAYALYALPDGKRPALVQQEGGSAIEVEVWRMPMTEFGSFVAGIPTPLGIGKVALASGECLPGFICEEGCIADAEDISHFGGWRAYLEAKE
ncbi:MAG: allophanate hydrolase [Pseudohongiella sp.]|nr:allophanate hydrolase [Pseudohongiella sp.]